MVLAEFPVYIGLLVKFIDLVIMYGSKSLWQCTMAQLCRQYSESVNIPELLH